MATTELKSQAGRALELEAIRAEVELIATPGDHLANLLLRLVNVVHAEIRAITDESLS